MADDGQICGNRYFLTAKTGEQLYTGTTGNPSEPAAKAATETSFTGYVSTAAQSSVITPGQNDAIRNRAFASFSIGGRGSAVKKLNDFNTRLGLNARLNSGKYTY